MKKREVIPLKTEIKEELEDMDEEEIALDDSYWRKCAMDIDPLSGTECSPYTAVKTEMDNEQEHGDSPKHGQGQLMITVCSTATDAKPSVSQEEIPLQESFEEVKSAVTVREPLCSEESERDQLNRHIHVYVDEKHKCDVCNKSFNYAGDLIRHNRRHTGEKPYQCELCVRSFSHNSNLVRHKRIHTGEKLYKCHECNKSFSDSSHLVRHAYVHSNEKPYKCDLCNKFFSQKSNLVRHKCIHTDEKP